MLRLVEHLDPRRVRGLIGPWSHQYPDRGLPPGPAIGFLQETLRWWDHWLKGVDNDVMDEPLLRAWISDAHPPATVYEELPGRWVAERSWPSATVVPVPYVFAGAPVAVASPQHTGLDAGRFFPFGNEADLPPDQREEDAKSACFEFPVEGDEPVEILGRASVTLRLRLDVPYGQVVARLCDVAPDGSSTLVTRGALNLSARQGRHRAVPWPVGSYEDVSFELGGIGHAFPPGHRIRLAVSSAYWPWIWPRAGSEAGWTWTGGQRADPARAGGRAGRGRDRVRAAGAGGAAGGDGPGHPGRTPPGTARRTGRRARHLAAGGRPALRGHPRVPGRPGVRRGGGGDLRDPGRGPAVGADPLAVADPAAPAGPGWDARVETRSEITCDEGGFLTSNEVVCREGDEVVFHRTWERRLPRSAG